MRVFVLLRVGARVTMKGVKAYILLAGMLGVSLISSCSWAKRHLHRKSADRVVEQAVEPPTPEQQEAAMQLLAEEQPDEASAEQNLSLPTQPVEHEIVPENEPDIAQQHGLRSPSLPKLLPMDIHGKLHTPSAM